MYGAYDLSYFSEILDNFYRWLTFVSEKTLSDDFSQGHEMRSLWSDVSETLYRDLSQYACTGKMSSSFRQSNKPWSGSAKSVFAKRAPASLLRPLRHSSVRLGKPDQVTGQWNIGFIWGDQDQFAWMYASMFLNHRAHLIIYNYLFIFQFSISFLF
jgi:hypothetical protein